MCLIRAAGMRRFVLVQASWARPCVLKPMLLPFVLAAGVLAGEGFLADAADTVRRLLGRLVGVLLADVA